MGIQDAIFTPDQTYLITCGQDKTLKFWDKHYEIKNPKVFAQHSSQVPSY